MAVKLPDGKIARTQPEQVKKNMDDIESMKNELVIIKEGIASAYKIQGSEDVADLNALEKAEDMNGYVYNMLDAGNLVNEDASTLAVQIGDNVVFVWNGGDWYWDRLAGLVDTSNLCTLDTDQTITGNKTFDVPIKLNTSSDKAIEITTSGSNGGRIGVGAGGLYFNSYNGTAGFNSNVRPYINNANDLGTSSYAWKNLYLSGKIDLNNGSREYFVEYDAQNNLVFRSSTQNVGQFTIKLDNYTLFTYAIRPAADNGFDIGSSTIRYRNIYIGSNITDGTNSISVEQLHKIIHHKIVANGKIVNLYSYYNASYAGSDIESLASVAGETVWAMKAYSITNHPDLIVVSDGGLAYFTNTGVFTKYLDPTDTIDSDTFEVF